ncbi:mediator of RNA polymerase II transcription subunit 27-like [Aphis craccivora]|uniref:Mediator of RNA polymerase II transcription subunit 27-like n=1 Tax=Aphis craccivora TaxID=307492 RepID=A0A6G0YSM6_APHCR|nr:mediator of RNA polymerase II transcription subunit 27-like [Aphis craccivora]
MELNPMQLALNTVRTLRLELMQLIIEIGEGVKEDGSQTDTKDNRYMYSMNEMVGKLGLHMRDLEQVVGSLSSPPGAMLLYNTSFLTQESTSDRQALYTPLVSSHKWLDKVHKFSSNAVQILSHNSLKKSYYNSSTNKKKRQQSSLHNISPQAVDVLLTNIDRMFPDMSITITRPCASNVVLLVGLSRVLQAIISFKGVMIEWVIVKGFNEPINPNSLQQELWQESRYHVFRKITDHANAAMLHFSSPTLPDLSVRSFMTWLNSYLILFNSVCKACGNRLLNAYPPTWRDLRSLDTYHYECKP